MNRLEAKVKIRNHLKLKGNYWCDMTEALVTWWWRVINKAIFGSILPLPIRFEFRNFHNRIQGLCCPFGRCINGDVVICLRREYDTIYTFLTVLIHEMVHQYQWYTDKRITHGKTFYTWEQRVKTATGLPLHEYVDD